jgi:hypothetical protein
MSIALLRDPAESLFAPGRMLSRHQADPCRRLRPDENVFQSQISATSAVATIGPTPGISSSRRLSSLERCQAWIRFSIATISALTTAYWRARMPRLNRAATGGKWLELLTEVAPGLRRVAGILDPGFRGFAGVWRAIENMAPRFGLEVTSLLLHAPTDDLESAVDTFAQGPGGGLIVLPTAINAVQRNRIFSLAARNRLPAVYAFRFYATDGGLMSYGIDTVDLFRRGASYVDRILKGEKPADLPVQAPIKFEMVINLKTAKALGLNVPDKLLALADEVVE